MTKPKLKKVATASASKKTSDSTRAPNIEWAKNPDWTWSLIAYLTDHPNFRIKLFSDSTADANKEGRNKAVAKDGKPQQYAVLAEHIFENDQKEAKGFKEQPGRFATSVETRLRRLKKEYTEHVKALGQTGAGLAPEDVIEGSALSNLVESIVEKWPWWKEFHGFWRELPNYNPIGVSNSSPGVDHAANALMLFEGENDDKEVLEDSGDDQDLDAQMTSNNNDGQGEDNEDEDGVANKPDKGHLENGHEESEGSEASESEDENEKNEDNKKLLIVLKKPKGPTVIDKRQSLKLSGRDAGLAKANVRSAGKKTVKQQTATERFNDYRKTEADRIERKRERDHELKMEQERNKCIKYEYKQREATAQRASRLEELRLQIELARLTGTSFQQAASPTTSAPLQQSTSSYESTPIPMSRSILGSYNSLPTPSTPVSGFTFDGNSKIYGLDDELGMPSSDSFFTDGKENQYNSNSSIDLDIYV